jgi:hypothetical protein
MISNIVLNIQRKYGAPDNLSSIVIKLVVMCAFQSGSKCNFLT